MFIYNATILKIKDGDTIIANVDLGFDIWAKKTFRLLSVDTPELFHPSNLVESCHALLAKRFLEGIIPVDTKVIIQTEKTDKYGRFLANIYLDSIDLPSVNSAIISNGFEKKLDEYNKIQTIIDSGDSNHLFEGFDITRPSYELATRIRELFFNFEV